MDTQRKRKLQGLCTRCAVILEPEYKFTNCVSCRRSDVLKEKSRQAKRVAARVCIKCQIPLDETTSTIRCKVCSRYAAQITVEANRVKANNGICRCGNIAVKDHTQCLDCKEFRKQERQARYEAGVCTDCGKRKIDRFKKCVKCRDTYCDTYQKVKKKRIALSKTPEGRMKVLLYSYLGSDRKRNRVCDLDLTFIKQSLEKPCFYCGENDFNKLGLDRIDNTKGHLKSNVNTCCSNCNSIRSSMPYDAWIIVSKTVKEVKEKGLLEGWHFQTRYKPSNNNDELEADSSS